MKKIFQIISTVIFSGISVIGVTIFAFQSGGETTSLLSIVLPDAAKKELANSNESDHKSHYSSEQISTVSAIFSDKIPLIESALADYYSYGAVSGLALLTKEASLSEIISNIEILKKNEDIINSQLSNSSDYSKFCQFINKLPQLEKELRSMRE